MEKFIQEGEFEYWEEGTGSPLVILHGLMGDISNFHNQVSFFSQKGYRVLVPHLPLYSLPLATTGVKSLTKWVKQFVDHLQLEAPVLLGNSLGGHIALVFNKLYPGVAKGMVLFGSSGLYESAMGNSYPRRGDYSYIEERVRDVFFQKQVVTKELVDEVFSIVNDRMKAIKTLAISKSAIRHNMAEDLPNFHLPTCIIWGKQDAVTPPEVADKFNELLPQSELHWIDQCGHAPMMEHPEQFNKVLLAWLEKTFGVAQATPALKLSRARKAAFIKSSSRTDERPPPVRPEFAFIGRSNVGKSSLINRLVGQKDLAKVSQRPGKTQLINHFSISDGHWYLVDLPGYGYAKVSKVLRESFSRMIGHYLRNRENLVCIFVLVDARHSPQKLDLDFMAQLAEWQLPFALVFTKADKLTKAAQLKTVENYQRTLLESWEECPPCFLTSAETGKGKDALLDYLESLIPIFDAPQSSVQNP